MSSLDDVVGWSRAVADENRLRILLICHENVANVREIATITQLSDPLVSHHLATLLKAGLVERRRVSRTVEYRVTPAPAAARWVATLAEFVGKADPRRLADQLARSRLGDFSPPAQVSGSEIGRLDRAMVDFARDRLGSLATRSRLRLCVESDREALVRVMLASIAHGVAIASSAAAAARLRRVMRDVIAGTDLQVTTARALAGDQSSDVVVVDCVDRGGADELEELLPRALQRMRDGSLLILFVPYDALSGDVAAEHPLLRLRRTLSQYGMQCEQIRPIEAAGQHILAAAATLRATSGRQVA